MIWTTDQENAIYSKGNTIVTAAAGSGKTAVLVERVIKKLSADVDEERVSADRLLIVTFTNAAAAEMRRRIEKALDDKCMANPDDTELLKQRLLIPSADICTIDSFCIRLVRNNFSVLGISPDFTIADDVANSTIKHNVCKALFNEYIEKNDSDFLEFLSVVNSEYGTSEAEQKILEINNFCQQLPQGYNWLKSSAEKYNVNNFKESDYFKFVLNNIKNTADKCIAALNCCKRALSSHMETNEYLAPHIDNLLPYISKLAGFISAEGWDDCHALLQNPPVFLNKKQITYKKIYDRDLYDQFFDAYLDTKDLIEDAKTAFFKTIDDVKNDFELSYRVLQKIYEIVLEFNNRYFVELNKKSIFPFSVVERLALELLTDENEQGELVPSKLSKDISAMYDEVMVDEYQDINDLQGRIFEILSDGCKKLFTVGDIKQSIYGFRGSNPEIFSKRSEQATLYTSEIPSEQLKRIVLSNNFRSRKGVCDFVNAFFATIMSKEGGAIEYNSNEMLYNKAEFPDNAMPAVEAHFITAKGEISAAEAEAKFFAEYVEKTVNSPAFLREDKTQLRKATYGDFALLLQTRTHINEYLKELKKRNIPVSVGGGNFFETTEIITAVSIIKAVENPMDNIAMLSVMSSPLFGFTEEEIIELKLKHKSKKLYSIILKEAEESSKCAFLKEKISLWRSYAACVSTSEFVSIMLIDSGYINMVLSMSDSERRQANLCFLEQLADSYFSETSGDLTGFIEYLKYLERLEDTSSAAVSGSDSVKITTMHKSKGLQYPITVLGGLGSDFNNKDISSDFLMNENLGIAFKYIDTTLNIKQENLAVFLLKNGIRKKQIEEEMRLLYVAMTRAEERLVMLTSVSSAFIKNLPATVSTAAKDFDGNGKMLPEAVMSASGYDNWLIPILLQTPSGQKLLTENGIEPRFTSPLLYKSEVQVTYNEVEPDENEEILPQASHITPDLNSELKQQITDIFEYEYPYAELNKIEVKTSVSELTKRDAGREFSVTSKPAFLSKSGLTPTERGTALHKFMQYADFKKAKINPESEIERLYEYEYITRAEADVIDVERVNKFVQTKLFDRILNSNKLFREQRFLLDVRAGDIYPDLSDVAKDQTVIVQGAVDCMFIEDDHIVIIDFKTDRTNDEQFLLNHYAEQLKTYSVAAEKMFALPVTECYIYSLHMSKTIKVELQNTTR